MYVWTPSKWSIIKLPDKNKQIHFHKIGNNKKNGFFDESEHDLNFY